MEEEVFSLAPETPRRSASSVAIGVLVAVVLIALFVVSQRFDSSAHHYDTAAASRTLTTAAPGITAPPPTPAPTTPPTAPPTTAAPRSTKFTGDGFRAAFPVTPERGTQSLTLGAVSITETMYIADTGDAAYAVAVIPLPAGADIDLARAFRGAAAGMGGEVQATHPTTFGGYSALEGTVTSPEGNADAILIRMPSRVLMVFVGADNNVASRYTAFRNSLEIL